MNGPILERKWTRVREDEALGHMFRDASSFCQTAITTVMRQDRQDVSRPLGGWLDGLENTRLLAQIAYDNGGALVQALAPGCGKTRLIQTFTQLLNDNGLVANKDYFTMSVTHVAAALADGCTIARFRHAGRYKKGSLDYHRRVQLLLSSHVGMALSLQDDGLSFPDSRRL